MAAVADLERFLERVFERTSARLFRSHVQAVHVERRVERAMEAGRSGRGGSTVVPSRYRVRLHPADLDDLAARNGGPEALQLHLAERALAFARLHQYHLAARPTVALAADPSVEQGRVEVDADPAAPWPARIPGEGAGHEAGNPLGDMSRGALEALSSVADPQLPKAEAPSAAAGELPKATGPAQATPPPPAAQALPPADGAVPAADPGGAASHVAAEGLTLAPIPPQHPVPGNLPPDVSPTQSRIRSGDRPYAVRPATPARARARLRVLEPGGVERVIAVEAEPLTLGRAPDNVLVVNDARVSRHHGRFQTRHGTLVYTDLGSTNGTRVNGIRVDEIVLGPGDRLQVGDAVVVVEQLPG